VPVVSFGVPASVYDRFMGRFSVQLAPQMATLAGVEHGQRVLDVGCGPGALTTELVRRLGPECVTAVDPAEGFVETARERHPGVAVERATAEQLPFADDTFDAALAQLVVHFMTDPVAGLREMARVTRPGGVVAACVWDHAGGTGPLSVFWEAARELDPDVMDESALAGARAGHLAELSRAAGLRDVQETSVSASVEYETFDEWWDPFLGGVGPGGAYVVGLDDEHRTALRERCREKLSGVPFAVQARAWASRGLA
jgi:SAM-dependent methyltransferase